MTQGQIEQQERELDALIKAAVEAAGKLQQFLAALSVFRDGKNYSQVTITARGYQGDVNVIFDRDSVTSFVGDDLHIHSTNAECILKALREHNPESVRVKKLNKLRAEIAQLEAQVAK